MSEFAGGTPAFNADAIETILGGARNAGRDVVLLNAAAGFLVAGKAADLREGIALAASAIDGGAARHLLARLRAARVAAEAAKAAAVAATEAAGTAETTSRETQATPA
jgi:anthranilate phosphoribosyltransferase